MVINFLSKNLRRFSYTKDFAHYTFTVCICITPRVLLQIKSYEEQRKSTQIFTKDYK